MELTLQRDGKRKTAVVHAEEVPSIVIDALLAELTGLQVTEQNGGGFRIQSVRRGSGASRVGLTDGDLLLTLDLQWPKQGSAEQRQLLERLQSSRDGNLRQQWIQNASL